MVERQSRGGHLKLYLGDRYVATCPFTPGDYLSIKNLVLTIRRITGIDLRED